jgi:rhodanese-related sulfurtransferase
MCSRIATKDQAHVSAILCRLFSHSKLDPLINLEPRAAHEFLQATPNAVFIDCRSETEYFFVGHPVGARHVAWSDGPLWELNPEFVTAVSRIATPDQPVVLICRSGNRSLDAGKALENAGFTRVYHVVSGFEGDLDEQQHRGTRSGWRHDGLPWEQT